MASLTDLTRDLQKLKTNTRKEVDAATMRAARQGVRLAKKLSSGSLTTVDLRRKDNPYARRHGSPKLPTEFINSQSGVFREAWTAQRTPTADGTALIRNTDPKAKYLEDGTDTMFARPIDVKIELFVTRTALPAQLTVAMIRAARTPHG